MKKIFNIILIFFFILTMSGCHQNTQNQTDNDYKKIIQVLFQYTIQIELKNQETKSDAEFEQFKEDCQESIKDEIGHMFDKDTQIVLCTQTLTQLQDILSTKTFPISIHNIQINEKNPDMVTVYFSDENKNEKTLTFQFEKKDNLISAIQLENK